jgi:hypothetical protein
MAKKTKKTLRKQAKKPPTPVKNPDSHTGLLVGAGALIGLGAGLIIGQPVPGVILGLALGFAAAALAKRR